jgi:hypothetical protein
MATLIVFAYGARPSRPQPTWFRHICCFVAIATIVCRQPSATGRAALLYFAIHPAVDTTLGQPLAQTEGFGPAHLSWQKSHVGPYLTLTRFTLTFS